MSYIIAIPSYKRSEKLQRETLSTLKRKRIPKNLIDVYVANKEEYDEYKKVLNPDYYNRLIIGVKGLVAQREFIEKKYPTNKKIVFIDDDIRDIYFSQSSNYKNKSLDYFFKDAFDICEKEKAFIWSVYPVDNTYFMKGKKEYTTNLKYIIGGLFGIINRPSLSALKIKISRERSNMEDIQRSILYFKHDGVVVRFKKVGKKTTNYSSTGGMGTLEERLKYRVETAKKIKEMYPEYGDITRRPNGNVEFTLKNIKRVEK